ncbi:hypothetical protein B0H34DRAFT_706954 [Crassisporium funariophilum]|nr:hypothetical protein B0H34DRAFT_706954 [Crassisporium funariophilum]
MDPTKTSYINPPMRAVVSTLNSCLRTKHITNMTYNQDNNDSSRRGGNFDNSGSGLGRDNTQGNFGGNNNTSGDNSRDIFHDDNYDRSLGSTGHHRGTGSGTSPLNPTTEHHYGHGTTTGQYDSSRVGSSGMESDLRGSGMGGTYDTPATGYNSGEGIHARQYHGREGGGEYGQGNTTYIDSSGTGTGHHLRHDHDHDHAPGQGHQANCERCLRMSEGQIPGQTQTGRGHHIGRDTDNLGGNRSDYNRSNVTTTTGTDTTDGPSPYNLRPGETIVEKITKVHHGLSPGEVTGGTTGTGLGSGRTDNRENSTLRGANTAGTGIGSAGMVQEHDASRRREGGIGNDDYGRTGASSNEYGRTGASQVGSESQRTAGSAGREGEHSKPSMADKIVGGMEKAAGKMTSNAQMYKEGEKRATGEFETPRN